VELSPAAHHNDGHESPSPAQQAEPCRTLLRDLLTPIGGSDAADWSNRLIDRFGSLAALLAARPEAQARVLPDPDALSYLRTLRAALLHTLQRELKAVPILSNSRALLDYLHAQMAHLPAEQVRALFLDSRKNLILDEVVGLGTIDEAPIFPREIIRRAMEVGASGLVLVHNHPSGNPSPSAADLELTRSLARLGRQLDVTLHDHVVIGRTGAVSLRALGLL
jgi:DNA repair protein RadC